MDEETPTVPDCDTCTGESSRVPVRDPGLPPITVNGDALGIKVNGQRVNAKVRKPGKRSLGISSFLRAKTGGKVEDRIASTRANVCASCYEEVLDENGHKTGERLYRAKNGVAHCGNPHGLIELRDEVQLGCGCELNDKVRWADAECPRGRWGPGDSFGPNIIALFLENGGPERLKGVVDFIAPTSSKVVDMLGIGDTVGHSRVARALHDSVQDRGERVRFCTVTSRVAWAEFCLRGTGIEVSDLEDKARQPGIVGYHSAAQMLTEMDATILENGWGDRFGYWAQRFQLRREDIVGKQALGTVSQEWWDKFSEFIAEPRAKGKTVVALAPYSNGKSRNWPLPKWMELAHRLIKAGYAVFCHNRTFDPKNPKKRPQDLGLPVWNGDGSPDSIAAGVVGCDILVGNDSGLCHVAGHFAKPALAICGPTRGDVVFSGYKNANWIQAPGSCTGCGWFQEGGWQPWCAYGCGLLAELKPEVVQERIVAILSHEKEVVV